MKAKKQAVKKWLHGNMHKPIGNTMKQIQRAMQGHFNYYGVSGNFKQICKFWKYVKYSCYKVLNKRHQKRSMKYPDYLRIWKFYVTESHLTKRYGTGKRSWFEEPYAGKPHVRFCEGYQASLSHLKYLKGVSRLPTRLFICQF